MTDTQIDAVFEKYDKNKDGRLDFEEFKELMESNRYVNINSLSWFTTPITFIFSFLCSKTKKSLQSQPSTSKAESPQLQKKTAPKLQREQSKLSSSPP